MIGASDFDSIYRHLLHDLNGTPEYISRPKGKEIHENLCQSLSLLNPRARLLHNKERNPNYGFAVGEFLWYWRGAQDLKSIRYYNRRMADYSDDGRTLNSAYGYRMREELYSLFTKDGNSEELSMWDVCVRSLVVDNDTRQAVMVINEPIDEVKALRGSRDVPCTMSLQFFIRDARLHLHVHMRSNDVIWGLTNDLFSFTLLQECMMIELKSRGVVCELGSYHHTAGSMHLYEQHYDLATRIVEEYDRDWNMIQRPAMAAIPSLEQLSALLSEEDELRNGEIDVIEPAGFTGACRWMAEQLNAHRRKRDGEREGLQEPRPV